MLQLQSLIYGCKTGGKVPPLAKDSLLPSLGMRLAEGFTEIRCQQNCLDVAQYLIKWQNCNSEIANGSSHTLLHIACKSGHLQMAKYLIVDHKCNPHCTDKNGYTPLHAASESGNIETVKYLITEQGCDPQVGDSNGATPLHYASKGGHMDIMQYLINDQNCHPKPSTTNGRTPLHNACKSGHLQIAKYLITDHKCNPHCTDNDGYTPLHAASESGNIETVKYLITEQRCDPQVSDSIGNTPLHYASESGHLDIVQCLIKDFNCDPQKTNSKGSIPLHYACRGGQINVCRYLIDEHQCNPNCTIVSGNTLLHLACQRGHLAVAMYLIDELGCIPTIENKYGRSPLHFACLGGHLGITKYLISDCSCNPHRSAKNGNTPLHYACENGHLKTVKYLITEHNCNPELKNVNGYTPLHSAASNGHLAVVKCIVSKLGDTPQILSKDGYTPLHFACQSGHLDITKYLISCGNCDPNHLTYAGLSPLDFACRNGYLEIVKYLITEHKCSPEYYTLHSAASNGHLAVVKYLISELNCNPHIVDNEGFTSLHYACLNGHLDISKYLMSDCNCNPHCSTKKGFVPIHHACQNGHLEVAKYLIIEHKCSPKHGNVDGYTPLHSAASNGHLAVVKYLINELGCNLQIPDNDGSTPLHEACLNGHLDVANYLITECNYDPKYLTSRGFSPLDSACRKGHLEIMKYLITKHSCCPEYYGYSTLHSAAASGHLDVVQYLIIELGCKPEVTDNDGSTPLHCACENGHVDIAKYLITKQNCDPKYLTSRGFTPLDSACRKGHLELAKYLVTEHNCSPECCGYSTLHSAASNGHLPVVKYLIHELGCNPQIADSNGLTPLHYACLNRHLDITKYLISDCNCNPECSANNGNTLLHCACENGHLEVAKYLITEHQCNPEHGNVNGYTPLHLAASNGHLAVVKYLISELDCNPQIANNDGHTPLYYACLRGHADTTNYLTCFTENLEATKFNSNLSLPELPPMHTACMFGQLEIAKHLVTECKCDPNCTFVGIQGEQHHQNTLTTHLSIVASSNSNCAEELETALILQGFTPLHTACMMGHLDIAKYLISECKCYPNCAVVESSSLLQGVTPLHIACMIGHLDLAKYLISECKCDPSCVVAGATSFFQGITPLHTVCMVGHLNIAKYLVTKCRCDPNCVVDGTMSLLEGLTPLHMACMLGHLEIVEFLVAKCKCDPNCAVVVITSSRQFVITPLKLATAMEQHEIVEWLVSAHNCNREYNLLEIFEGLVCMFGQLIDNMPSIFSNLFASEISHSFDSLMIVSVLGWLNIAKYLVDECGCDPHYTDDNGTSILHIACASLQYLWEKEWMQKEHNTSATNCTSNFGIQDIFLQIWHAIIFPVRLFSQLFPPVFSNPAEDPSSYENTCDTRRPIHINRQQPYLDIVKYFINNHNCNPQCTDADGETPLHYACASGQLEIVKYFYSEKLSDLVHTAHSGDTPLHFACKYDQVEVVNFLLSTGECDPLVKNAEGLTPVEIATSPEISEQLDHFCKGEYPLESVVKVFVLGDPLAGKSSLVQAIKSDLGFLGSLLGRFQKVKGVRHQTAGIDQFSCSSTEFGNVIIYDFAGQREFHTSHAAFLHNYSTHMAGIFIIVIDITLCEDDICQSLRYWMSFVQDCCSHNEVKPHVIVVGSHADQLDDMDGDQALTVIQQTDFFEQEDDTDQPYELVCMVCLDCTRSASDDLDLLRSYLQQSCDSIRDSTEKIDQRCYVLHRYMSKTYTETDIVGHTLGTISTNLAGNSYLLPSTSIELLPLFQTLHDKGQVVLLESNREVSDSWVITNIAALLKRVVGGIFAPRDFPQHIAPGSTGIVPKSRMSEVFPDLNIDMIIEFLDHFEFCHQVEPDWLGETQSNQVMSNDEYYLFPALLTSESIPQVVQESYESSYCCGWLMYSTIEGRFFPTRFLHVLLLRLAFQFAPPQDDATPSKSITKSPALNRKCIMWENGISWPDTNGVKAVFELKNLKTAILKMTCMEGREIHCVRLRTKLINIIIEAKNEICPHVNVEECIMEVEAGNLKTVVEFPSHSIKYLTSMIVDRDPKDDPDLILTHSDGSAGKRISELLYFEPYAVLSSDLITQLFAKENAKKLVSINFITKLASHMYPFTDSLELVLNPDPTILSEKYKDQVHGLGEKSRQQLKCKYVLEAWKEQLGPAATYRKLRQELNKYSIFCGRNPLNMSTESGDESSDSSLEDDDINDNQSDGIILTEEDLSILLNSLKPATPHWKAVGLALGFLDHELTIIERTPLLIPEGLTGYFREMLSQWLRWAPPNHSWPTLEALRPALQSCGQEGLAVQLMPLFLTKKVATWPSKEQRDGGDILAAEIKSAKCHKELESCESGKKGNTNEGNYSLYGERDTPIERSPFQRHTSNMTAEDTEESEQRSIEDTLESVTEDVMGYNEALQQIADIATDLLSKHSEFVSKEKNQRSSALHSTKEDCRGQESSIHTAADVTTGSEQKDIVDEALQQITDITENLVSGCFELLEFQDSPRAGIAKVAIQEGIEDGPASELKYGKCYEALQVVVDIAEKQVSRCFEFELSLANQERETSQKNTALHIVCGDPFAHHSTRETLRQIVDIAIDLLCRCSKLQTRIQSHSHVHQFTKVC